MLSYTANIIELRDRCQEFRRLCRHGYVDEWLLETLHANRLRKFKPFEKEIRRSYFWVFAPGRMLGTIRLVFSEVRAALNDLNVRTGGTNPDLVNALKIANEYLESLPKPKTKSWKDRIQRITPFSGPVASLAMNQDPMLVFLIGTFVALGVAVPVGIGLLSNKLLNDGFELYWVRRCVKNLGIQELKNRIIDETMQRPLR